MASIRTAFVSIPAMIGGLIKTLAHGRIDLEVVVEYEDRRGLRHKLRSVKPDLVIVGLEENENSAVVLPILMQIPSTKLIVFSSDGRDVASFELRTHRIGHTDLSVDRLINFIERFH